MKTDEIDQTLRRLRESADAISANLLEIELDPNRRLLDETALTGESAKRWAEASGALTQLWQWYSLLDGFLQRANELRGSRPRLAAQREAELTALLEEASIEFVGQDVPLEERQLLVTAQAQLRCSPDELLSRMSVAFDEAKTVVAAIGSAWETFVPRVRDANATLLETVELAGTVSDSEPREVAEVRDRLGELGQALSSDPLSVSPQDVESLQSSLAAVRQDLEALAETKRGFVNQRQEAVELLERVRLAAAEAEQAHRETLLKIAAADVPEPPRVDRALDAQLEAVCELADRGAWREAREGLERWTADAESLLARARDVTAANRTPIEMRNQLRGLLSAYQGKARQLGLIEDAALIAQFRAARDVLYSAPTDLEHAAELVRRYQRGLAENPKTRKVLL